LNRGIRGFCRGVEVTVAALLATFLMPMTMAGLCLRQKVTSKILASKTSFHTEIVGDPMLSHLRMIFSKAAAVAAAAGCVAFASCPAMAAYPERPVTIVVGAAAGGGNDIAARLLGDYLSRKLGVAFVIDNRPGASGARGAEYFAGRPADGYTLLLGDNATQIYNKWLLKDTTYDPGKQSIPAAIFGQSTNMLVVHPDLGVNTVAELVALAKSKPGTLDFGSAGNGGSIHLAGEYFKHLAGIDVVHVPYKSTAEMVVNLVAGNTDYAIDNMPNSIQAVRDGKLKALAVTSADRWPDLLQVPTMEELGYKNFALIKWYGIFAQTGTDPAIVKILNTAITEFLDDPAEGPQKLTRIGAIPFKTKAGEYGPFLDEQAKIWRAVIDAAGITAN
jgi:tripartite-type tricarboxylate transporter receptor subunit TctC